MGDRIIGVIQGRVSDRSWRPGDCVGIEDEDRARELYEEGKFEPATDKDREMLGIDQYSKSDDDTREALSESTDSGEDRRAELEALPWTGDNSIRSIASEIEDATGEEVDGSEKSDYVDFLLDNYTLYLEVTGG